jgi:hypothetical protein
MVWVWANMTHHLASHGYCLEYIGYIQICAHSISMYGVLVYLAENTAHGASMSKESVSDLPPYFNLSPDAALDALTPTVGTTQLADIAAACGRGRDDLTTRGLGDEGRKRLRLFSTWEITRYLIPVAQAHFRRVLKANPTLPQGRSESDGGAKWFTLDEVQSLRTFFATEGRKSKDYLPYRPKGLPAKMIAVANFKGGVGKTSTCAHLAMSAALDGYKVLVVDLDSQGSMTSIFGGVSLARAPLCQPPAGRQPRPCGPGRTPCPDG